MISTKDAEIIAELFYLLDAGVRDNLSKGFIADERDYMSRLVNNFNYPYGILNKYTFNHMRFQSKWFAKVNSSHNERKFGCDSMIVFKIGDKLKVGLFEAKWPRVILDPKYQWDYTQKSTKTSHFTDQINRQSKWTSDAAIWEMFFYEQKVGLFDIPFDKKASSCVRHQSAINLINTKPGLNTIWNNLDLKMLIKSEQTKAFNGTNETNIKKIIYDILTCNFGSIINLVPTDNSFLLTSTDKSEKVKCPILSMTENNEDNQNIENFMNEYGLSFFQQLNISIPKN